MVFFNYSTMQMVVKVVYYGPGLCGKTTNLEYIYSKTAANSRGEMVSLETETDRTLFFDLLPIDVGVIGGFKTKFQLYTVPGQVFYNSTRKLVLKGVDGIIFVADSQVPMLDANIESYQNMMENFRELDIDHEKVPIILQYNKRDLNNILSVDVLNKELNKDNLPYIEASALNGNGVFETLKLISKHTLLSVKDTMTGNTKSQQKPATPKKEVKPVSSPVQEKKEPVVDRNKDEKPSGEALKQSHGPAVDKAEDQAIEEKKALSNADTRLIDSKALPVKDEHLESKTEDKEVSSDLLNSDTGDTGIPTLTLDDIEEKKPKKKRKSAMDLSVDDLLSDLVPTKQTFTKQIQVDMGKDNFNKTHSVDVNLEFKDENGNIVNTQNFNTSIMKKKGTKKILLKYLIDLLP